jgi:hypothetical protein
MDIQVDGDMVIAESAHDSATMDNRADNGRVADGTISRQQIGVSSGNLSSRLPAPSRQCTGAVWSSLPTPRGGVGVMVIFLFIEHTAVPKASGPHLDAIHRDRVQAGYHGDGEHGTPLAW